VWDCGFRGGDVPLGGIYIYDVPLGGIYIYMSGVWFLLWTAGRVCVRFVWLCCEVLLCFVMVVFVR